MRGLARKGVVTGSLDGGAFTIRRARAPAREPRQRCHLLPWPSMASAARWRKRKGERRRVTGHGPVAGLRPCAGGAAPHSRRQRSGRAAVGRRHFGRFGHRRSVRRKEGRGEMVQGLGQLTGDAGFARPESTEDRRISSDGPERRSRLWAR